jgi:hypothetical protein
MLDLKSKFLKNCGILFYYLSLKINGYRIVNCVSSHQTLTFGVGWKFHVKFESDTAVKNKTIIFRDVTDSLQYGRRVIASSRKSSTKLHGITIKETRFLMCLAWLGWNKGWDNRACLQAVIYCLFTSRDILPVCKPWYTACLRIIIYCLFTNRDIQSTSEYPTVSSYSWSAHDKSWIAYQT